jgi:hypothetical protein
MKMPPVLIFRVKTTAIGETLSGIYFHAQAKVKDNEHVVGKVQSEYPSSLLKKPVVSS